MKRDLNRRYFFDSLAKQFNITSLNEWKNITPKLIFEHTGEIFSPSTIRKALIHSFPEFDWKPEYFPKESISQKSFWKQKENFRKFLDKTAKHLDIKINRDWGKVSPSQLVARGGIHFLRLHNYSLLTGLKAVYPGILEIFCNMKEVEWDVNWFVKIRKSHGFWQKPENQRKFLQEFATIHNIKSPEEWGRVSYKMMLTHRDGPTLLQMYNGSVFRMLCFAFPNIQWNPKWFLIKKPATYWMHLSNQKNFIQSFETRFLISKPEDWMKITITSLGKGGGWRLLDVYGNSLLRLLETIYPKQDWKGIIIRTSPIGKQSLLLNQFVNQIARDL